MKKQTVIVIGADAHFFDYLMESLNSLLAVGADAGADIAILDIGLAQEQLNILSTQGYKIVKPEWTMKNTPDIRRKEYEISYIARTALRDYFPGYETYLWFDSDAWAQTPEFLTELVNGAKSKGAAVIRENGKHYKRDFIYNKWLYGNMIMSYGVVKGIKASICPSINIGILCMSANAPHWDVWIRYYEEAMRRTGKINMDQHAYNAAIELEGLPHHLAPARCNWIPTLSTPSWNKETNMICEPDNFAAPISIIHLAGPNKKKEYSLSTNDNGTFKTALNFKAIHTSY